MFNYYPQKYIITSGWGKSVHRLVAFDNALINAGISNYNLLKVSSILPEDCTEVDKLDLRFGSPLLTAYGSISSNEIGRTIASAVGVGIPMNSHEIGIIMEYSGYCTAVESQEKIYEMIESAMKNHNIAINEIKCSAIDKLVEDEQYISVISALSMW